MLDRYVKYVTESNQAVLTSVIAGLLPGTDGYELVAMINVVYLSEDSAPSAMHGTRIPMGEFVTTVD